MSQMGGQQQQMFGGMQGMHGQNQMGGMGGFR
jgi:hypothetical protein